MVVSARVWWLGGVLAVLAGIGLAVWWTPHTVDLPAADEPGRDGAPASAASQPAVTPAPPTLATAPSANPPGLSAARW